MKGTQEFCVTTSAAFCVTQLQNKELLKMHPFLSEIEEYLNHLLSHFVVM